MTAPVVTGDEATAPAQANPDSGTSQVSVYNGPTADPAISARTLVALEVGETPVVGARRVDHNNSTDYGFGALGIEYLLTTTSGVLIPDVGGLIGIDVLANDEPGGSATGDDIDRDSLTVTSDPSHGAAAVYLGTIWYAPVVGYDGSDQLSYTVDNRGGETSSAADADIEVVAVATPTLAEVTARAARRETIFIDPYLALADYDDAPIVQAVEITTAAAEGTATVVGRRARYVALPDFVGRDAFSWRFLINGSWTEPAVVNVEAGPSRFVRAPLFARGRRWPKRIIGAGVVSEPLPEMQAIKDFAVTANATAVTIDVLENDVGDDIAVFSVGPAPGGEVVDNEDGTVTYTPDPTFSGLAVIPYRITDGVRLSGSTINVTVEPPTLTAADDADTTSPATPVVVAVLDNDEGVGMFVAAVSNPPHGSASITDVDQTVTYEPDAGWVGEDSFTYTVEDENGAQRTATVRVTTISAIAAVDDVAGTPQGSAVTVSPLGNDTGVGLAIVAIGAPANGTAQITGGGTTVTYTPNPSFVGQDRLSYTIEDDYGQQRTALIRIGVTSLPVAAVPDEATTVGVTPVEIAVLANDVGDGLTVTAVTQPPAGQGAVVRSSGNTKVTYTAPPGFSGTVEFEYTCGNSLGSSTAPVSVTVTQPALTPRPDAAVTISGQDVVIDPLANDVGTSLEVVALGAVTPAGAGTAAITDDGATITFTPGATYTGPASFSYTVEDSSGFRASSTVAITVNAPPAEAFSNGYEAMGEVWVSSQTEAMTDFPLLVDYSDPLLRLQGNGGVVRNSSGHDIRFEDGAGNKLEHVRLTYNGTTGRVLALVKRGLSTALRKVEVYAGKQGSVTDEEDAGALDGHLAYWRMDTGADLTGNGRNLTVSGAVAATLFGCPAATFDGVNDGATLANPSAWLGGVSELTLLVDLHHAQNVTDAGFFRVGGIAKGSDTNAHWIAREDQVGSNSGTDNYRLYNSHWKFSSEGNCRIEGEAERLQTAEADCYAAAWKAGEAIAQFSRGTKEALVFAQVATPSSTLAVGGGPLAFGNGTRAYWGGTMGLARIAATRRSDAWILAEMQNRLDPALMLSKGVMRTPAQSAACVAFPDTVAVTASPMTISPLANDTGTGLSIVAASASVGSVAVAGSQILFTPPAAFTADARITYSIRDSSGRISTSVIIAQALPTVSIAADADNVDEGDSGTTAVTFTVSRTGNLDFASTVDVSVDVSGPLSVDAADFVGGVVPDTETLRWDAGEVGPKTFTVEIQGDLDEEPAETLKAMLSQAVLCRIGAAEAVTTIGNDDVTSANLSIAAAATTVIEGDSGTKTLRFVVTRSGNTGIACSASWTRTGTADGSDITAGGSSGTVEFEASELTQNIDFTLAGDTDFEADETVIVTLSSPVDCTILVAAATATIVNDDIGDSSEFPTALRTLTVDNASELTTLINTTSGTFPAAITISGPDRNAPYRAGDLIVLKNGAYNTVTLSRSGTASAPIFIKAENKLGVTVNGTWTLSGSYLSIWGIDFSGASAKLATSGNSTQVIRCKIRGIRTDAAADGGKIAVVPTGQDNWFLFCEWTDIDGRGVSCDNTGAKPLRPLMYRCYFHDWKNPLSGSKGNARECIQFGQTQMTGVTATNGTPCYYSMQARALYCLFEDVYASAPSVGERTHDENEPLSNKCSGNEITGCTFKNSKNLNIRFGTNCIVKSNWIGAGSQIGVYGDGHLIIANNCSNGNYIGIFSGAQYQDIGPTGDNVGLDRIYDKSNDYPACRRVKCIGNIGELRIGQNQVNATVPPHPKVKAKGVRIEAHSGTIKTQVNYSGSWDTPTAGYLEENTTYSASPSETAPAAVQLTSSDVGVNAPWSVPPPVDEPEPDDPDRPKDPGTVAANKQIWIGGGGPTGSVGTHATLAAAYAAASAGDHIYLPAGATNIGTVTFNRTFTTDDPVVIRGRPMAAGSASPNSTLVGQINVSGQGHWFHEIKTNFAGSTRDQGDFQLTATARYLTITRCWITGRHGIETKSGLHHIWIGWNRFTGRNTPTGGTTAKPTAPNCSHLFLRVADGLTNPASGPHDIFVYRNFFWDDTNHSLYGSEDGGESMSVYVGHSHPEASNEVLRLTNVVFEENYFPKASNNRSRPRSIYTKRGCDIIRNRSTQVIGNFGQRHGAGSRIYGNRVAGQAFIIIGDEFAGGHADGTDVRNNVSTSEIRLFRATIRPSGGARNGYQAADWVTLYKNQGNVQVGYPNLSGNLERTTGQGGTVSNVRIYGHVSGNVVINGATDVDAGSITQNSGNPLNLTNGAELIPADFDGRHTGFETGDQGL